MQIDSRKNGKYVTFSFSEESDSVGEESEVTIPLTSIVAIGRHVDGPFVATDWRIFYSAQISVDALMAAWKALLD